MLTGAQGLQLLKLKHSGACFITRRATAVRSPSTGTRAQLPFSSMRAKSLKQQRSSMFNKKRHYSVDVFSSGKLTAAYPNPSYLGLIPLQCAPTVLFKKYSTLLEVPVVH